MTGKPGTNQGVPFPELIANEKGYGPLVGNSVSSQLRRKLLHGETVSAATGEQLGASNGLLTVVVKNMEQWGFEFELVPIEGQARKATRLKNPSHVPTTKTHRVAPIGVRAGTKVASIMRTLEAGEELSTETVADRFHCVPDMLRKAVRGLEQKGVKVDRRREGMWTVFSVPAAKNGSNGNGHRVHQPRLDEEPPRKRAAAAVERVKPRTPVRVGDPRQALFQSIDTPMPAFGGLVQTVGQFLNEDGSLTLAIRSDEGSWVCDVKAHTPPTPVDEDDDDDS